MKTYSNIIIHYRNDFKDNPCKKETFPIFLLEIKVTVKRLRRIFMIYNDNSSKVAAVICEYNPFHSGHAYQLSQTRASGATHIVAIMSGSFVQRGEPAMFSKWARTKCALAGGADLVLELPLPWCVSSAEGFAKGGVALAEGLGCVDLLSFGSELGEVQPLRSAAEAAVSPLIQENIRELLSQGLPYPAAREKAIEAWFGPSVSRLFQSPNNILAIEYCKALNSLSSPIQPMTIPRTGASHDAAGASGAMASASYLRACLLKRDYDEAEKYFPPEVFPTLLEEIQAKRAPCSLAALERPILSALRKMAPEDFAWLPDVSEGLEYRIAAAVKETTSLDQLFTEIKTKRYTHARIRRIIISVFLGIHRDLFSHLPPYLRVLGFNQKGTEILKTARQTASLPIIMRGGDFKKETSEVLAIARLGSQADDLFALSSPEIQPCGSFFTGGVMEPLS